MICEKIAAIHSAKKPPFYYTLKMHGLQFLLFYLTVGAMSIKIIIYNTIVYFIVRMNKSRRLRWAGHVARMEKGRSAFKILTGR